MYYATLYATLKNTGLFLSLIFCKKTYRRCFFPHLKYLFEPLSFRILLGIHQEMCLLREKAVAYLIAFMFFFFTHYVLPAG